MDKKTHDGIRVRAETKNELDKRKAKCSWKTARPRLTWDEFLLELTRKWKNGNS